MIKHYVEFIFPGFIMGNSSIKEVKNRDPKKIEVPTNCVSFRFFDREETISPNGNVLQSEPLNYSDEYYPGGMSMSLEQVKVLYPKEKILISNIEGNKYGVIVRNRYGGFMSPPSDRKMVVL